jgi:hypothetical protein
VLARVLLYAVLAGVLIIPAVLWIQARSRYLWARIESVTLEVQADPTCTCALQSLDDEFSEWGFLPNPALGDPLRARVERLRGIIAARRGDAAEVERAFSRARNLDVSQASVDAMTLEWVRCRLYVADVVGAKQLLNAPAPTDSTLALWRHVLAAQVLEASGKPDEARMALRTLLDRLPKPLAQAPKAWFMLDHWRIEDVMIEAVGWVVSGLPAKSPMAMPLWRQLAEFCPEYLPALIAATEGLVSAGDTVGARALWTRIRRADPAFAAKEAQRSPRLAALDAT